MGIPEEFGLNHAHRCRGDPLGRDDDHIRSGGHHRLADRVRLPFGGVVRRNHEVTKR